MASGSAVSVDIAKATFGAALVTGELRKLARDEVSHFHVILSDTLDRCSPQSIQVREV